MSLQIRSVLLYNKEGDIRQIDFRLGTLNIITGKSNTGKSTLLDIVEYCMGHSEFHIPVGPIRDTVSWYCVLFQLNDSQVLVAKRPPNENETSNSEIFLRAGTLLEIPEFKELHINSNDSALIDYFSNIIGISPNLNIPEEGQTRRPLEANFKHSHFYLFQKSGTVADQEILFHHQGAPYIPQTIKDTLPYFLGIVQENRLKLVHEYRNAKKYLAELERKLEEAEVIADSKATGARALFVRHKKLGLSAGLEIPMKI